MSYALKTPKHDIRRLGFCFADLTLLDKFRRDHPDVVFVRIDPFIDPPEIYVVVAIRVDQAKALLGFPVEESDWLIEGEVAPPWLRTHALHMTHECEWPIIYDDDVPV